MKIKTDSGEITVSKRSRYGAWLQGRIDAGGWTGHRTVSAAWDLVKDEVLAARTLREARTIGRIQHIAFQAGKSA